MAIPSQKIAFVVVSSPQGTLILNRLDYNVAGSTAYGVGLQLLENGSFDETEVDLTCTLLELRRKYHGDGVVAIDCGANIGVHTIKWSRLMTRWGKVISIEAQERIFYALAGNIAINNCFNARAIHAAITSTCGSIRIPTLDYQKPASFGSLEINRLEKTEQIGQVIDYSDAATSEIPSINLDSLKLDRCDLIKVDVEGMEISVLEGASATISQHRPIILAEMIKSNKEALRSKISSLGYQVFELGLNFLAVHGSDPCLSHVSPQP
jgi:FkbM family methyltransferase